MAQAQVTVTAKPWKDPYRWGAGDYKIIDYGTVVMPAYTRISSISSELGRMDQNGNFTSLGGTISWSHPMDVVNYSRNLSYGNAIPVPMPNPPLPYSGWSNPTATPVPPAPAGSYWVIRTTVRWRNEPYYGPPGSYQDAVDTKAP